MNRIKYKYSRKRTDYHVRYRQIENKKIANPPQTPVAQNGHPEQEISESCEEGEKCDTQPQS